MSNKTIMSLLLQAGRPIIYNSLIVSVTILDKILLTGFTTDVAEANATTSKIMSNSLPGTIHVCQSMRKLSA